MTQKRRRTSRGRKRLERKNPQLLAHITSLGLEHRQEYDQWCRRHGFACSTYKSWREQRAEFEFADGLREQIAIQRHIETLGCATAREYEAWCRQRGPKPTLEKSIRQRRREWELARREEKVDPPQAEGRGPTVDRAHLEALGLSSVEEYGSWCRQRGFGDALNKSPRRLRQERELAELEMTRRLVRRTRDAMVQIESGELTAADLKGDHLHRRRHSPGRPLQSLAAATRRLAPRQPQHPASVRFAGPSPPGAL